MEPDAIDVAIAKHCGWSRISSQDSGKRRYGVRPNSFGEKYQIAMIPQFHACLNTMHKAEAVLTQHEREYYRNILFFTPGCESPVFATAAQKSKAFLQAIFQWQEPDKLSTHIAV
jgi:hypothetical protein